MATSSTADPDGRLAAIFDTIEAVEDPLVLVDASGSTLGANHTAREHFGAVVDQGLAAVVGLRPEGLSRRLAPVLRTSLAILLRFQPQGSDGLSFSARRLRGPGGAPLVLLQARGDQGLARRLQEAQRLLDRHEARLDRSLRQQERLRAEAERLHRLSVTDRLTGLLNAAAFTERAEARLHDQPANDSSAVFVYLDLDGFKPVNDTHGHDAGDAILRHCAAALRASLREEDLAGRLGGDEFGVLLTGSPVETEALVGRLREALAAPMSWDSPGGATLELSVRASCGTALAPRDGVALGPLRRAAEKNMYSEKAARKGGPVVQKGRSAV